MNNEFSGILPKAEIIAIGTELVIGQVADTNSRFLSAELESMGFSVRRVTVIPDDRAQMEDTIRAACALCAVTIITGGLGPTEDDFTKAVLLDIFGGELVEDRFVLQDVTERMARRGMPLTDRNREQALVPTSCEVLRNQLGTAPGMFFKAGKSLLFSLPGVPYEMRGLFESAVKPRLEHLVGSAHFHRTLKIFGIAESTLADRIAVWERDLAPTFSLAYLPSPEYIQLRLSASQVWTEELNAQATQRILELQRLIPDELFGEGGATLASTVLSLLQATKSTLALAESCTGGGVGAALVAQAGASSVFLGGMTTYCDAAKERHLGVRRATLERYGAVSGEVVLEMAEGVRRAFNSDYGLAVSGLLDATGATELVPGGTLWIGCSSEKENRAISTRLTGLRTINLERAVHESLNHLRKVLLSDYPWFAFRPL